jgi:hypothetical protein
MPIAEPDRTKGAISEGLDGGKRTDRGCEGTIKVGRKRSGRGDEQLCAFPYRTPVGVMLKEGIASAENGSFGAGMVVGR